MAKSDIPKEVRKAVLERDSIEGCPCCIWCGRPYPEGKGMHLHHVIRRSQGGGHNINNLVSLCFSCHMALHDGDKQIQEYAKDYLKRKDEGNV